MRALLLLTLLLQVSCATKYILPGNRFITPETQGGSLQSQFEIGKTTANELTIDTSNASVTDGVNTKGVARTNYLFSSSIIEQFDWFWSHVGSGNSLLGGKFQFVGGSKLSKAAGHKLAVAAAIGSNEHKTDDSTSIEFTLQGQEFLALYGYRFNELFLVYSSLSYSQYDFRGKIASSNAALDHLQPKFKTTIKAIYGGVEMDYGFAVGKVELGYQQLATEYSKDASQFIVGYSFGIAW